MLRNAADSFPVELSSIFLIISLNVILKGKKSIPLLLVTNTNLTSSSDTILLRVFPAVRSDNVSQILSL